MMYGATKLLAITSGLVWPATTMLATIDGRFAIITAAATIGLTLATWVLYVEAMRLKRLRDEGELALWHYPWALVVLPVGLTADFLLNVVVGLYWKEAPRWGDSEWLLTHRLDRWARDPSESDRRNFAWRVCRLLNKHDERHCFDGSWRMK